MIMNCNTLTEVMQNCLIYDNPAKPLKEVSANIGKPYFTMTRELNPDDDGAKLGADLLLPIMRTTGDTRPLEWLAEKMGYKLTKVEVDPDRDNWEAEHVQDSTLLGKMAQLMDDHALPSEVDAIVCALKRELDETAKIYVDNYGEVK